MLEKTPDSWSVWKDGKVCDGKELQDEHVGALIGFKTKRGEKIQARVASSFIGFEQAERNLKELEGKSFDQVKEEGRKVWDKTLGVFDVEMDLDEMRTFYSCFTVLCFSRAVSTSSMPVASRFIIVPTMVKYCRGICLPIPVFGILSVVFFRC